ncbi:MAG: TIGR01212 family radical SAM protein [bacterium]
MNYPWGHDRPYNAYAPYFRKLFGERVQKISVDAGFNCPNRDGTKGRGGCTYCNNDAFNPSYCHPDKSLETQIAEGIEFHKVRYRRAEKYLVYFQPYSNTHAPVSQLSKLYEEALKHPKVIGLVISTRPDCVDNEKLDLLEQLSRNHYLSLEFGVESMYDRTLQRINRMDTFRQAKEAIKEAAARHLHVGAHFIFGLPGETREMMMDSVHEINKLPLKSIKFHQLQIVKGTVLAIDFEKNKADYPLFSFDEYIDFIIRFIELLNPDIIIERFAGEVPPRFLSGPGWGLLRNDQVSVTIERELRHRKTWQGRLFQPSG